MMLTNHAISEAEWIAYLQENLTSPPIPIEPEGDRGGMISLGKIAPIDRISQTPPILSKPVVEVATSPVLSRPALKDQFRDGIVDRVLVAEVSATNLSKSGLAIKAKPEWTIANQQVYRQIPPVPMLSDPQRVGDFLLWPDPQEDSIEIELPERFATKLGNRIKPLPSPVAVDERIKINRLDIAKSVVRPGLMQKVELNSLAMDRIDRFPIDRGIPIQELEIKRAQIKVRRAFFATVRPEVQSFHLTIQQGLNSLETTGTALITISLYAQQSDAILEKHRLEWTDALAAAGYGSRLWKFLPVNLQKLEAFLDIDPQQLRSPIQIAVNLGAGTATFLVELSTIGAQVWQQALETRRIDQIIGLARFTAKFYARTEDRLQIREQPFAANLATLLANCGPEHMDILSPTLALSTSLIVQSHAFVDSVAVTWQPKQGGQIIQRNFAGNEGGTLMGVLLTDNLNTAEVSWNAQVQYRLPSWSVGAHQGNLSLFNPMEIIKPGSSEWIREYTVYTVMMVSPMQVATNLAEFEDIEVEAMLSFSADYLTLPLSTTFQPRHLDMTEVPFPVMPGQGPNQVGISVVTRSKSSRTILASMQRILQIEDQLLNIKIFRNGQIDVRTSTDPIAESSIDGGLFELLGQLK
jgi:hypothetical protein